MIVFLQFIVMMMPAAALFGLTCCRFRNCPAVCERLSACNRTEQNRLNRHTLYTLLSGVMWTVGIDGQGSGTIEKQQ
jgi:hypothetical protein